MASDRTATSSHRLQPGGGRRSVTSRAARQRGGARAGVRPLRPLPNPPGCACAVATRAFKGFSPVCVRPNQEEIYSRGQVKEITRREVRKPETGEGGRPNRRGHLRFSSRECAVGFRRNLTKITFLFACPRPVRTARPRPGFRILWVGLGGSTPPPCEQRVGFALLCPLR